MNKVYRLIASILIVIWLVSCSHVEVNKPDLMIAASDIVQSQSCGAINGRYQINGKNLYDSRPCQLPLREFGQPFDPLNASMTPINAVINIENAIFESSCKDSWFLTKDFIEGGASFVTGYEDHTLQLAKLKSGEILMGSHSISVGTILFVMPLYQNNITWCVFEPIN